MSRYIDVDTLKRMIEAKADTLIEGKQAFNYVAKWLDFLPAIDVKADTVKKMQERLKAKVNADIDRCYALGIGAVGPLSLFLDEIDEVAKELLEESEGAK